MISEEVQLRLMTYFFDQSVSEEFHQYFHGAITDALYDDYEEMTDDELVAFGVELINQYMKYQ